jgi:hypothetical protein
MTRLYDESNRTYSLTGRKWYQYHRNFSHFQSKYYFAIVGAVLAYEKPGSNILSEVVQVIVHSIFYSSGLMRLICMWFWVQHYIILILTVLWLFII